MGGRGGEAGQLDHEHGGYVLETTILPVGETLHHGSDASEIIPWMAVGFPTVLGYSSQGGVEFGQWAGPWPSTINADNGAGERADLLLRWGCPTTTYT